MSGANDFDCHMSEVAQDISYLSQFEQVAQEYQHRQKFVKPADALITSKVYLKWYDIYPLLQRPLRKRGRSAGRPRS